MHRFRRPRSCDARPATFLLLQCHCQCPYLRRQNQMKFPNGERLRVFTQRDGPFHRLINNKQTGLIEEHRTGHTARAETNR